jgi:hypothetical protein
VGPELARCVHQEITRPTRTRKKKKECTRKSPDFSRNMGLPWSVVLWSGSGEAKEKKKTQNFNFLFFSGNPRLNLIFGLITRKVAYYYRDFTKKLQDFDQERGYGNYQETTRNSVRS